MVFIIYVQMFNILNVHLEGQNLLNMFFRLPCRSQTELMAWTLLVLMGRSDWTEDLYSIRCEVNPALWVDLRSESSKSV